MKLNIFKLLAGNLSEPEFVGQVQMIANVSVRPYVLPFLQSNIPKLREEIKRYLEMFYLNSTFS